MTFDEFTTSALALATELRPDQEWNAQGQWIIGSIGPAISVPDAFKLTQGNDNALRVYLSSMLAPLTFPETWDEAKALVYPFLVPATSPFAGMQNASIPYVNGTRLCIGFDFPELVGFVSDLTLAFWDIDFDTAHTQAIANLVEAVEIEEPPDPGFIEEGAVPTYGFSADLLTSSYLLHPDLWPKFHAALGETFCAFAPSRKQIIMLPCAEGPGIASLRAKAAHVYVTAPHPLSPHMFIVSRDGLSGTSDLPT